MWISATVVPLLGHLLTLGILSELPQIASAAPKTRKFTFDGTYPRSSSYVTSFEVVQPAIGLTISIANNTGTIDIQGKHFEAIVQGNYHFGNDSTPLEAQDWQYEVIGHNPTGLILINLNSAGGADISGITEIVDTTGEIFYNCMAVQSTRPTERITLPENHIYPFDVSGTFDVRADTHECPRITGPKVSINSDCSGKIADYDVLIYAQYTQLTQPATETYLDVHAVVGKDGKSACLIELYLEPELSVEDNDFICFGPDREQAEQELTDSFTRYNFALPQDWLTDRSTPEAKGTLKPSEQGTVWCV